MIKKNKFKIAFIFLISYLIAQPFISDKSTILGTVFMYGLVIGFLLSPYLLSKSKKWLAFGLVAICIALIFDIINYKNDAYFYSSNLFELTLHFTVILYLFQHIISAEEITDDMVYASLLGYFLLAIGFAHAYSVLDELGYVTFKPEIKLDKNAWNYVYYSFTTLTTLGLGDIVPVSSLAKRLSGIESATGVLYVAVFIGRLIGIHSTRKRK